MPRGFAPGSGAVIPIATGEKARLEYWERHAKCVPPDLLRELGWLTAERVVPVSDPGGHVKEVRGDQVHTDVLFPRPRDRRTEAMWEFLLQLGHRRLQERAMARDYLARRTREVLRAEQALAAARTALDAKLEEIRGPLRTLEHSAAHQLELARVEAEATRAARQRGDTAAAAVHWRIAEARANTLHALRSRIADLKESREELTRAVNEAGSAVAEATARKREWETWEQPAYRPGLFGWICAFLTQQQMDVAHRATRELSRAAAPKEERAALIDDRLDRDEPVTDWSLS